MFSTAVVRASRLGEPHHITLRVTPSALAVVFATGPPPPVGAQASMARTEKETRSDRGCGCVMEATIANRTRSPSRGKQLCYHNVIGHELRNSRKRTPSRFLLLVG